ncbi:MAG: hypothetical protein NZM37_12045 [Sandaracinaceae bacterium]|nr:hypothetical protein [Sandaracinaceae bacterium]
MVFLGHGLEGCGILATHDEARSYRRIRTAKGDRERLLAMVEYLKSFPNGAWSSEVRKEHEAKEGEVWAKSNTTLEGLEFYLRVYPEGQHVMEARSREAALRQVVSAREQQAAKESEAQAEQARKEAEERRQWVTRTAQYWLRVLTRIGNYGSPIAQVAQANPDFSRSFGGAPEPNCTPGRCIKTYHAHYAIPVPGGTRIERDIYVVLRLFLPNGRLERVELLLPNRGFSRWYELENRVAVLDEDPESRLNAIQWALSRLEPVINEVLANARSIDFIPDPIEPIRGAAPFAASASRPSPSAQEVAAPPPPSSASRPVDGSPESTASSSTAQSTESDLEALLMGAVKSGSAPEPSSDQPKTTEQAPQAQTTFYPLGLRALEAGPIRFVIFAAPDDDTGEACDGFFIQRSGSAPRSRSQSSQQQAPPAQQKTQKRSR